MKRFFLAIILSILVISACFAQVKQPVRLEVWGDYAPEIRTILENYCRSNKYYWDDHGEVTFRVTITKEYHRQGSFYWSGYGQGNSQTVLNFNIVECGKTTQFGRRFESKDIAVNEKGYVLEYENRYFSTGYYSDQTTICGRIDIKNIINILNQYHPTYEPPEISQFLLYDFPYKDKLIINSQWEIKKGGELLAVSTLKHVWWYPDGRVAVYFHPIAAETRRQFHYFDLGGIYIKPADN